MLETNLKHIKQKLGNIKASAKYTIYKLRGEYYNWVKPKIVKIKGIQICVPENIPEDLEEALYYGYYEENELKIIRSQLKPDDIVMELGTGLGLLSTFCASQIGSDRVFTYEANPELKSIIQHNYALNKVSPHLENCMLGDEPKEVTFYVSDSIWDSSNIKYKENLRAVQITVKALNKEIKKINPSFMIIDIEGGEYELFQDIDFHNVKKLAMELHEFIIGSDKAISIKSKLTEAGFKLNEKFSYGGRELFWERN